METENLIFKFWLTLNQLFAKIPCTEGNVLQKKKDARKLLLAFLIRMSREYVIASGGKNLSDHLVLKQLKSALFSSQ